MKQPKKLYKEFYIIFVNEDKSFLESMKLFLSDKFDNDPRYFYNLLFFENPIVALKVIDELEKEGEELLIIITDQIIPKIKGIDLLRETKRKFPDSIRILLTEYAGIEPAISAINDKVLDKYLLKPTTDKTYFVLTIKHLVNEFHLKKTVNYQKELLIDLYEFSNKLNSMTNIEDTLKYVISFVQRTLQCDRISIFLLEGKKLSLKASIGLDENISNKTIIELGKGISGNVFINKKPILVKNISNTRWEKDKINLEYDSFMSIPLICSGLQSSDKPLGVINTTNKKNNNPFYENDLKAFSFIADTASIAINNQINHNLLEETYYNTITSLGEALEAKDSYTQGHSSRVTDYSIAIAKILELSSQKIEVLKKAAILHDIGKIGIKDSILLKPGKLSLEEFNEIKKHPEISENIINPISFLKQASKIVRHHHERFDGNGYPDKLAGDYIPLESRIMTVADSYDAMTSSRPYKESIKKDKAVEELKNCSNSQFDPNCANALIKFLSSCS